MPLGDRFVEHSCPAKLNLSLAILGKRPDGFHDLHSLVAQTRFGDHLRMEWEAAGHPAADRVNLRGLPVTDGENTVARAIRLFREATGLREGAFTAILTKRIPVGAGLGGGSSDAVAALKALRDLFPDESAGVDTGSLAARIGSDCPLFLEERPVIMEGRGERIRSLGFDLAARLSGQPVILFKPGFSIPTAEAYRRLARGKYYSSRDQAEALLDDWSRGEAPLPPPLNDFERLVADWLPSLAVVLDRLRKRHGLEARMSGSGSACFVFPCGQGSVSSILREELRSAWGDDYWMEETNVN